MEEDIEQLRVMLKSEGQEHVLAFWDELDEKEKTDFISQIKDIDFSKVKERYEKSKEKENFNLNEITPLPYFNSNCITEKERKMYEKIGEEIVKRGEVAVVSMAGGQRNKTWVPWA